MEGESLDCFSTHHMSLLCPFTAMLLSQLHKPGYTPGQVFGVEGWAHQLAHVQVVIEGQHCN